MQHDLTREVTLLRDGSLWIADDSGDVTPTPGQPRGLFVGECRLVSRWELTLRDADELPGGPTAIEVTPERAHRRGGAPRGARRRPRDSPAPASTRRPRRADRDNRGPQRDRRAASSVPPAAVRGRLRGPVPPAGAGELRPLGRTHERRGDGGRPASDPHTPAPAANSTPSHSCPPIRSRSSPISTTGGS